MPISRFRGKHSVFINDRGGQRRITQLRGLEEIVWNRVRDDISTATVKIGPKWARRQQGLLEGLLRAAGRYEMCIYRGQERVWEGPLQLPQLEPDLVTLNGKDVMHYANRLVMFSAYDNSYPNVSYVTTRAKLILDTEFARKDAAEIPLGVPSANVAPYIVEHHSDTDAKTTAKTFPHQYYVFTHIDNLAFRSGMDYTVIGRAIHLWDTSVPAMGYLPTLTDTDFFGKIGVNAYGAELATTTSVTDGQGNYGIAGEPDSFYGLVELLATAYDENAVSAPTTAELESQAQRNLSGRNPTPILIKVPDNSQLRMNGKVGFNELVPGVYVPVRLNINGVDISQMQKLQTVRVTETPQGESVQVSLVPATAADEAVEE